MRCVVLLMLLILLPLSEARAEEPAGQDVLLQAAVSLRASQVRIKDFSLRAMEIILGGGDAFTEEEGLSLGRMSQRLSAVGTVVSYEASRLDMFRFIRDEHRQRFARMLAEELKTTVQALSLDEDMAREGRRAWSRDLRERLGPPDEIIGEVRRTLESVLPELKKLGGQTI